MFKRVKIQEWNEFFLDYSARREKGVYFYRITHYHPDDKQLILRYYEEARLSGVVIEGGIANPDERNLAYYREVMGTDFQLSPGFLTASLKRWLPRMKDEQRTLVGNAVYDTLFQLKRAGKNENILKNTYIKFMCWLYYKFERIVNRLGENPLPKILYEGKLGKYELYLFSVLSRAGCDIILLLPEGEDAYQRADGGAGYSDRLEILGEVESFPEDFSLKEIKKEIAARQRLERLYGPPSRIVQVINTWAGGNPFCDAAVLPSQRGQDGEFAVCTCFYQVNGVEDKLTYLKELYQLQQKIKEDGRNLLILEENLSPPTTEEIQGISRENVNSLEEIARALAANIRCPGNNELQRLMIKVFLDWLLALAKEAGMRENQLINRGVRMLCLLKRHQALWTLDGGDSEGKLWEIPCMIVLESGKNENRSRNEDKGRNEDKEAFIRLMARLPVDVLLLNPENREKLVFRDPLIHSICFDQAMRVEKYPQVSTDLRLGTAAFHAEQELDSILYQDSGLYRERQFSRSEVITLQTMYEEIAILWDQELKFRPNFEITEDVVSLPVFFAKVSGVKDGMVSKYWSGIRSMVTEDTLVIRNGPYILPSVGDKLLPFVTSWLKDGRLLRKEIQAHREYAWGFLREELQEYLLDQLQLLLDQRLIRKTFENGTEYTIISVILALNKEILRLAQRFDFTKKNPKLIYVSSTEAVISLEDSILAAYLHLVGFDVLFFVPTGYQTVERHFRDDLLEEHQAGEYLYDLRVPDLGGVAVKQKKSWLDRIFG